MLTEIKQYCAGRGVVSLHDLKVHFRVEADVMRRMLEHWIRKGRIRKHVPCGGGCGSRCGGCNPELSEFYQWLDPTSACPDRGKAHCG